MFPGDQYLLLRAAHPVSTPPAHFGAAIHPAIPRSRYVHLKGNVFQISLRLPLAEPLTSKTTSPSPAQAP